MFNVQVRGRGFFNTNPTPTLIKIWYKKNCNFVNNNFGEK